MKRYRRCRWFSLALGLAVAMASVLPLIAIAASHEATRTAATISLTSGEPSEFGPFWQDAEGGFHIRGQVSQDELTGDIAGTATTITNIDLSFPTECEGDECPVAVNVWGELSMEDEAGWWKGRWVQIQSFVPGEEYDFGYLSMRGYGGNAGKSYIGRVTFVDEQGATIEGVLQTMATPIESMKVSTTLCFDGSSWSGGYLSSGIVEGAGGATGEFVSAGGEFTHDSNLYGRIELNDGAGTIVLEFVAGGRDVEAGESFANHAFGTYLVSGGTGAYADLYGQGRVTGTATSMPQCASGFGAQLQFTGEAHMN